MRISVCLGVFLVALCTAVLPPDTAAAAEEVPDCATCRSRGFVPCPDCAGSGTSDKATIPCPDCKGEKTVECKECDKEGMITCPKCDGDKKIVSEEWKQWRQEHYWDSNPPAEPEKYVDCDTCKAKGKVKCPYCKGTKERPCPTCEGKGTVTGKGACPTCEGQGMRPCPDCAELRDGVPDKARARLEALEKARRALGEKTYWQQRRALVHWANGQIPEDELAAEEELTDIDDEQLAERQEEVRGLLTAVAGGAISFDIYDRKRYAAGLPLKQLRSLEQEFAEEHEIIATYLAMRQDFRDGRIDREGYEEAIAGLRAE
jgi:hypothetical protein